MILLLGVGTLYADKVIIYNSQGSKLISYDLSAGSGSSIHIDPNGKITIEYDSAAETININKTYNSQIIINITNSSGDVVFSKTVSASENGIITIRKVNDKWVIVTPTKSPIPPIAIALTLITIPIMTLRRYN
jgi:hypothetical protein